MAVDLGPHVDWFGGIVGGGTEVVARALPNGDTAIAYGQENAIVATVRRGASGKILPRSRVVIDAEPTAPGGVTTVREVFVGPLKSGFVVIASMADSKLGADPNLSLVGQVFGPGGAKVGKPFHVDAANAAKIQDDAVAVVGLPDGGFNVYFTERDSYFSLYANGLMQRRFTAAGVARGAAKVIVASEQAGVVQTDPMNPSAILKPDGTVLLAFIPNMSNGASQIRLGSFTPDGKPVGAAVDVDSTAVVDAAPSIARLKDGRYVMAYTTIGQSVAVTARLLTSKAVPIGDRFLAASDHVSSESQPHVEATANGGFAISWTESWSKGFGRLFDKAGKPLGNGFPLVPATAGLSTGYGGLVAIPGAKLLAYQATIAAGTARVLATTYALDSTLGIVRPGSPNVDRLTGAGRDDRLAGQKNADTLIGKGGVDSLDGGDGGDMLDGGAGPDVVAGGPGKDTLTGGPGPDSFVIAASVDGPDAITDFRASEGDRIAIRSAGFPVPPFGWPLTGVYLVNGVAPKPNLPVPTFLFDTKTKTLGFDPNGTVTDDKPLPIATLPGVPSMAASDFTQY